MGGQKKLATERKGANHAALLHSEVLVRNVPRPVRSGRTTSCPGFGQHARTHARASVRRGARSIDSQACRGGASTRARAGFPVCPRSLALQTPASDVALKAGARGASRDPAAGGVEGVSLRRPLSSRGERGADPPSLLDPAAVLPGVRSSASGGQQGSDCAARSLDRRHVASSSFGASSSAACLSAGRPFKSASPFDPTNPTHHHPLSPFCHTNNKKQ